MLPAALIPHAGAGFDRPVAPEAKRDGRAPAAHVPNAEREADAATPRPRAVGVDVESRAIQQRGEVGPVPRLAGRRGIARAGDVAPTQLERCDAELACDEVEVRFRREHVLRLPRRAHVAARHLVRVHGRRFVPRRGHAIALERLHTALDQEARGWLARGVRASVEERV